MELSLAFIACKLDASYSVSLREPDGAPIDVSECKFARGLPVFRSARLWSGQGRMKSRDGIILVIDAMRDGDKDPRLPQAESIVWVGQTRPPEGAYCIWVRRDAGGDAPSVHDVLFALLELFDRYSAWSDRVRGALLDHAPIAEVVRMLGEETENPYWLADPAMRAVFMSDDENMIEASDKWRHQKKTGRYPADIIAAIVANGDLERMSKPAPAWLFDDSPNYNLPFVTKAIHLDGGTRFYLFIIQLYDEPAIFDLELAQEMGRLIGQYIHHSLSETADPQRYAGKLLRKCLDGTAMKADESNSLRELMGWDDGSDYLTVVFDRRHGKSGAAEAPPVQLVLLRECMGAGAAFAYGVHVVFVTKAPASGTDAIIKRIAKTCEGLDWKAGVSDPFTTLEDLPHYYRQARIALNGGLSSTSEEYVFHFGDYSLDYVRSQLIRLDSGGLLAHSDLEAIAEYDRSANGHLIETLGAFLENERSITRTAKALKLHRNSVIYRIERIEQLMSTSLDDCDNRLAMLVSLQLGAIVENAERGAL